METITKLDFINITDGAWKSYEVRTGKLGSYTALKIYKQRFCTDREPTIYVITRKGILDYQGPAQYAIMGGKEGVHFKKYPLSKVNLAVRYANKQLEELGIL